MRIRWVLRRGWGVGMANWPREVSLDLVCCPEESHVNPLSLCRDPERASERCEERVKRMERDGWVGKERNLSGQL